jgi:hypothetical protein
VPSRRVSGQEKAREIEFRGERRVISGAFRLDNGRKVKSGTETFDQRPRCAGDSVESAHHPGFFFTLYSKARKLYNITRRALSCSSPHSVSLFFSTNTHSLSLFGSSTLKTCYLSNHQPDNPSNKTHSPSLRDSRIRHTSTITLTLVSTNNQPTNNNSR